MKLTNLFGILLLSLLTFGFTACNNDDKEPYNFNLETQSCEVRIETVTDLAIISGNGNYTIETENKEIVEASFEQFYGLAFGAIRMTGKKKGETTLTITDNVVGQTLKLKVKVIDYYLPVAITSSNHPAFTQEMRMFLVKNNSKDVYFFSEEKGIYGLRGKGHYEFTVEKEGNTSTPYLLLTYTSDENGKLTDAPIAPTIHKLDLTKSDSQAYELLNVMLDVDWEKDANNHTRTSPIRLIYLNMEEVGTGYKVQGYFSQYSHLDYMQEGYLE